MAVQIQLRRGTAAEWTSANPILADGELGHEKDTGLDKIGNGVDDWNTLSYRDSGGSMTDAEVKIAYENNADTNAFTDAEKTNLANQSGTNTGDQDISGIATNASAISAIQGEQTSQNDAIALNTAKVGVTVEEANPDVVPQAEAEAGTATTERIWTAERVKQAIDALSPVGSSTMATTSFVPYNTITSTDGQAAVEELKDELDSAIIGVGTSVPPETKIDFDGISAVWTTTTPVSASSAIFRDSIYQVNTVDYNITGTNEITFTYVPLATAVGTHYSNVVKAPNTLINGWALSAADGVPVNGAGIETDRIVGDFICTDVRISLKTADTTTAVTVDVLKNGVSIFTTPVTIDSTEKTSTTATTPFDFLASATEIAFADDDEVSFTVSGVTDAIGLKVKLIGEI